MLTRAWERLPLAGRLGAAVVAAAALIGLASAASTLSQIVGAALQPELAQREATWGPVYGFAVACGPRLQAGAGVLLVDPTDALQPPYPGAPRDADWNDQDHFAYALLPRSVTVLGHQPAGWDPAAAGQPYVAVWQQVAWRTSGARASAAQAVSTLDGSPRASLVCQYADAAGDRGWIYAIAPTAAAVQAVPVAGTPTELRPASAWGDYPRALLGLACLWVIGLCVLRLVAGGRLAAGMVAALALPMGAFAAAAQLLAYSAADIAWSLHALAPPWVALGAVTVWRERRAVDRLLSGRRAAPSPLAAWRALPADHRLALGALVALVAVVALVAPLSLPYSDGINFYYLKAKDFYLEGSVVPFQVHAHELPWSAPGHPPLVPLVVAWLYLFIGGVAEHASLLLWPALLASLLAAFYAFLRDRMPGRAAAWCTLAFALIASGLTAAAMQGSYTDLPLAVELLAACGLLATWLGSGGGRDRRLPAVAGLFLAAAAMTKEEGLVLDAVVIGAVVVALLVRRSAGIAQQGPAAVVMLAVLALASLPLLWLRLRYPNPELTVTGHLRLSALPWTAAVTFLGLAARAALRWFAVAAVVVAAAVSLGVGGRRLAARLDRGLWFLVLVIAGAGAVYWAAMIADPLDTVAELSRTSGRLLDQVLPLPFLAGAWLVAAVAAALHRRISQEAS
jgi:hypothetical protein